MNENSRRWELCKIAPSPLCWNESRSQACTTCGASEKFALEGSLEEFGERRSPNADPHRSQHFEP